MQRVTILVTNLIRRNRILLEQIENVSDQPLALPLSGTPGFLAPTHHLPITSSFTQNANPFLEGGIARKSTTQLGTAYADA